MAPANNNSLHPCAALDHDEIEATLLFADGRPSSRKLGSTSHAPELFEMDSRGLPYTLVALRKIARPIGEYITETTAQRMVAAEASAWQVAKAIGLTDLMTPTVRRMLPTESGGEIACSLMMFLPDATTSDPPPSLAQLPVQEIRRAAAFDYAIDMADRNSRNWGSVADAACGRHLLLFDHGFAFGIASEIPALRNAEIKNSIRDFADTCGGADLEILAPLRDASSLHEVAELLGPDTAHAIVERVRSVLS